MRHRDIPYECCRCGYTTYHKSHMQYHLNRNRVCPAKNTNIRFTDEIKEFILENRVYHPQPSQPVPPQPQPVVNNTQIHQQNNIHNVMNIITPSLAETDRVLQYVEYKNKDMIPLCDDIENMYKSKSEKLRNDSYKYGFEMDINDLLEIIDTILQCKDDDYTDLNVIYNTKENKINILDDTLEWASLLVDKGLKGIIEIVQDGYLHEYERYLILKITGSSGMTQQRYKERLQEYYKFIGSLDGSPLCSHENLSFQNNFINQQVVETYYDLFKHVKDNCKASEKNYIKRTVIAILKRNSEKNIKSLYTSFYDMFCKDNDFKSFVASKRSITM